MNKKSKSRGDYSKEQIEKLDKLLKLVNKKIKNE